MTYADTVLGDRLVCYLDTAQDGTVTDLIGGRTVTTHGSPRPVPMPGGWALAYDGTRDYLELADTDAFSIATTGQLTVEAVVRLDALQFSHSEGSGYVDWLGKETYGSPNAEEWCLRVYSKTNAENRPNRMSGYAFNPTGGLGAGSYVQEPVDIVSWMHVAAVFDTLTLGADGWGTVAFYKNGRMAQRSSLGGKYQIRPQRTSAPLRIGTATLASYLQGSVGGVAIYGTALPGDRIAAHAAALT